MKGTECRMQAASIMSLSAHKHSARKPGTRMHTIRAPVCLVAPGCYTSPTWLVQLKVLVHRSRLQDVLHQKNSRQGRAITPQLGHRSCSNGDLQGWAGSRVATRHPLLLLLSFPAERLAGCQSAPPLSAHPQCAGPTFM